MSDDSKIDELAERIRQVEAKAEKMPSAGSGAPIKASRIGVDFGLSVLGGALLGWLIDLAIPSIAPWPLIGMILAGFLSGLLNMWRSLAGLGVDKPVR
jgi:F0F1-type ATP synthase assembly protein I